MATRFQPTPIVLRFRPNKRYPTIPMRYPFSAPGHVAFIPQSAKKEAPGSESNAESGD